MRRIIEWIKRNWGFYSYFCLARYNEIDQRLDKQEKERKNHIKDLASRMNEIEMMKAELFDLAKEIAEDAENNESIIRGYEETVEIERSKLRIAEETLNNQMLRNESFRAQVKADIAVNTAKQVAFERPPERGE